jgi:hypothetical protein
LNPSELWWGDIKRKLRRLAVNLEAGVARAVRRLARRQLHLPTGDNYTSPSLRPAGT